MICAGSGRDVGTREHTHTEHTRVHTRPMRPHSSVHAVAHVHVTKGATKGALIITGVYAVNGKVAHWDGPVVDGTGWTLSPQPACCQVSHRPGW